MTNIHPSLEKLPKKHRLHPDKVKEWIRVNSDMLISIRKDVRQNVKGAVAKQTDIEGYIKNMRKYLRDGDWIDMFYGVAQEGRIMPKCVVMAYKGDERWRIRIHLVKAQHKISPMLCIKMTLVGSGEY